MRFKNVSTNQSSVFIMITFRFELMSNDDAFLSFPPNIFTQRTLLARFPTENSSFSNSFFIQKPIYHFFSLQSHIRGR